MQTSDITTVVLKKRELCSLSVDAELAKDAVTCSSIHFNPQHGISPCCNSMLQNGPCPKPPVSFHPAEQVMSRDANVSLNGACIIRVRSDGPRRWRRAAGQTAAAAAGSALPNTTTHPK